MDGPGERQSVGSRAWPWAVGLVLVTAAAYASVLGNEFVPYDDPLHVTGMRHVRTGLSLENAAWAFTTTENGYRIPLAWLSHQLDVEVFGLDPAGHHATSLLLHLLNTVLVLLVLARASGRLLPSVVVAGLFALHPLHVESVAWVSERKDVLSTFLALLALLSWVRHAERPTRGRYAATLVLFALALLAKPMVVTLPVLMLVLDRWPLARLRPWPGIARATLEKAPFLALSAAAAVSTLLATHEIGAMSPVDAASWTLRLDNALGSVLAYLGQALWPADLAVLYPYPRGDADPLRLGVRAAQVLLLTGVLLLLGRRRPYASTGWIWYLVALLPVVGLVQAGAQARADRYTYVPLLGPFWIVAFGGADLASLLRLPRPVPFAVAGVVLAALAVRTSQQVRVWRDGETLFAHALAVAPANEVMLMMQGTLLVERGRADEALPLLESALRLRPEHPDLHVNRANALTALGRHAEALASYERAVALGPGSPLAHYNLGVARGRRGDPREALRHYETAIRLRPEYEEAHCNAGYELLRLGEPARAVDAFARALALEPDDLVARRGHAQALVAVGRTDEAIRALEEVLRRRPDDEGARRTLEDLRAGRSPSSAGGR